MGVGDKIKYRVHNHDGTETHEGTILQVKNHEFGGRYYIVDPDKKTYVRVVVWEKDVIND